MKFCELGDPLPNNPAPVDLRLSQKDMMEVLTTDVSENMNPLVVNPTGTQSCGDWDNGGEGWEEDLALRSTLSMSLTDDMYQPRLGRDELVYSPTVFAFRGAKWQRIKSYAFSIISLQPLARADFSVELDREKYMASFDAIFQVAIKNGHKSVILNPFGVEKTAAVSWDNNAVDVARALGQVLTRYAYAIERVTIVFKPSQDNPLITTFRKNVVVIHG